MHLRSLLLAFVNNLMIGPSMLILGGEPYLITVVAGKNVYHFLCHLLLLSSGILLGRKQSEIAADLLGLRSEIAEVTVDL